MPPRRKRPLAQITNGPEVVDLTVPEENQSSNQGPNTAAPPELVFSASDHINVNLHLWIELKQPLSTRNQAMRNTLDEQVWTLAELLATAHKHTRANVVCAKRRYEDKNTRIEFCMQFFKDSYCFRNSTSMRLFAVTSMSEYQVVHAPQIAEMVRFQLIDGPQAQTIAKHIRKIGFSGGSSKLAFIKSITDRICAQGAQVFLSHFVFTTLEPDSAHNFTEAEKSDTKELMTRKSWEELFPRKWSRRPVYEESRQFISVFGGPNVNHGAASVYTVNNIDLTQVQGLH